MGQPILEHTRSAVERDGSVTLYFAPEPPDGRESNWIPTRQDGRFEVLCRFYGPQKAFFDKTWRLPDVERVPLSRAPRLVPSSAQNGRCLSGNRRHMRVSKLGVGDGTAI